MTPNLHVRQFNSQSKPSSQASSCITKKLIYLRSYFLLFRVIKVNVSDKYIEPVIRLIYINNDFAFGDRRCYIYVSNVRRKEIREGKEQTQLIKERSIYSEKDIYYYLNTSNMFDKYIYNSVIYVPMFYRKF